MPQREKKRSRSNMLAVLLFSLGTLCCMIVIVGGIIHAIPSARSASPTPTMSSRKPLKAATPTATSLTSTPTPEPEDPPARLLIPKLQLDANVEPVEVEPGGELATPQQNPYTDVGWYRYGPPPGALGSAVIDGHVNQPGGDPAIFSSLHELQAGDEVQVVTAAGHTLHFQVNEIEYYHPKEAPLQHIFGNYSGHYLNLISCAGEWIPAEQQTTLRIVVFTTMIA